MYKIKLAVILLCLLQPLIYLVYFKGDLQSFSHSFETELQPLFIVVNASSSFFFFSLNKWKIPALFLMLLTAFSTERFETIHNIFAVLFFLSCFYSLQEYKRMEMYLRLYCFSIFIAFFGLFWFEFLAVYVLCFYHLHNLYKNFQYNTRNI